MPVHTDLEAWWTLDDGEIEIPTSHQSWPSYSPPRSAPVPVPWAPHLLLGVAKDAPLKVIADTYQRQPRLYRVSGAFLSDKQRARAQRRVEAIHVAFAVLSKRESSGPGSVRPGIHQ